MDWTTVSLLGSFIMLLLSIFNSTTTRDKTIIEEAKWRGGVDAKLDIVVNMASSIEVLNTKVTEHEHRITTLENK